MNHSAHGGSLLHIRASSAIMRGVAQSKFVVNWSTLVNDCSLVLASFRCFFLILPQCAGLVVIGIIFILPVCIHVLNFNTCT